MTVLDAKDSFFFRICLKLSSGMGDTAVPVIKRE
jgi:hypothetical protein